MEVSNVGKEISSKPDAIRNAGKNIEKLETGVNSTNPIPVLPRTDGYSDGLVAEGINQISDELIEIEKELSEILEKLPIKLKSIAFAIEESDNDSAEQFH